MVFKGSHSGDPLEPGQVSRDAPPVPEWESVARRETRVEESGGARSGPAYRRGTLGRNWRGREAAGEGRRPSENPRGCLPAPTPTSASVKGKARALRRRGQDGEGAR